MAKAEQSATAPQTDLGPILAQLMAQVADLQAKLASKDDEKQKAIDAEIERAKAAFKAVLHYEAPPRHSLDAMPEGFVKVRVLPNGDNVVATGEYDIAANVWTKFKRGDVFAVDAVTAKQQETNGLLEIVS